MGDILRHTGTNIGGIAKVSWVFHEDTAAIRYDVTTLCCSVDLKPGRSWNSLYGAPETIQLESEQQDTPAGLKYIYKVKLLVPKDRLEVEVELFRMNGRWVILKITDKNGTERLLGTKETPMKVSSRLLKPSPVEGFNGFELTFTGEFSCPAGFIQSDNGTITDDQEMD
ncbi:MAG: hypothetical protein WCI71_04725 [Bacteroidota bacterium]